MLGNLKSLGNPTSQRLHLDADLHSELWLNKLARLTMMMNRMICILGSSADIPFFLQAFTSDDDDDDDIYIMMSVCLSEKSSLLGFSWFLVGFHGF